MKRLQFFQFSKTVFLFLISFVAFSQSAKYPIIPQPQSLIPGKGYFTGNTSTKFINLSREKSVDSVLIWAKAEYERFCRVELKTAKTKPKYPNNQVLIRLDQSVVNPEGYLLSIRPESIQITASKPEGVFYALQTLRQIITHKEGEKTWKVPCAKIEDVPRFAYRGIMLDVSRHFMPVDFLKKYLDALASLKINRFHWHLTDGQAFRFESKKYPKLHTATSTQWPTNEGYYTQDEMRAIVKYAAERFITVIPEIEMPGHSNAALSAYPQFACQDSTGKQLETQGEYCPKDETIAFLSDIIDEVIEIFPSKYIHIGGDEAGKQAWKKCPACQKRMKDEGLKSLDELQSYFIQQIEKHVNSKGRRIIGWDEIVDGGIAEDATVMSWRGIEGGIKAAKEKHQVIMTPGSHCYLDHYQSESTDEPKAFGGLTTLAKIYSYEPIPEGLTKEEGLNIIGSQGNLWTECVPEGSHAEYMTFPRAIALAEVNWSRKESKDFNDFLGRLQYWIKYFDQSQINYARHFYEIKPQAQRQNGSLNLVLQSQNNNAPIYYTLDGSKPTVQSTLYKEPFKVSQSSTLKAASVMNGEVVDEIRRTFVLHKAAGIPVSLVTPPNKSYNKGGVQALSNGILANDANFSDNEWLGWNGTDFIGSFELSGQTEVSKVSFRFFHRPGAWVYVPSKVSVWSSENGTDYTLLAETNVEFPQKEGATDVSLNLKTAVKPKWLKVMANCLMKIPQNYPGAGDMAWLFVDEIVVE